MLTSNPIKTGLEYSNIAEAQEKCLKVALIKMEVILKEDFSKFLIEI